MAPVNTHRRHWHALGLVTVLLVVLGIVVAPRVSSPTAGQTQQLLERLNTAVITGDRAAFTELFTPETDTERVETLWHNLGQLGSASFSAASSGTWQVDWAVPGETLTSTHQLRPVWQCNWYSCQLRELGQQPGAPTPIWLTTRLEVHSLGPVTVLGPSEAQPWLTAAQQAWTALQTSAPDWLLPDAQAVVLELPADRAGFEQVLAAPAIDFATIGAITWRQGQASHIVLNPDATAALTAEQRRLLVAHELVHVANAELGVPAAGQLWVSEGLAEALSLPLSADEQQRSAGVLAVGCPLSAEPPPDEAFTDPTRQRFAYAWSAAAVDELLATDDAQTTITLWWHQPGQRPANAPAGPCT